MHFVCRQSPRGRRGWRFARHGAHCSFVLGMPPCWNRSFPRMHWFLRGSSACSHSGQLLGASSVVRRITRIPRQLCVGLRIGVPRLPALCRCCAAIARSYSRSHRRSVGSRSNGLPVVRNRASQPHSRLQSHRFRLSLDFFTFRPFAVCLRSPIDCAVSGLIAFFVNSKHRQVFSLYADRN
jgi:hypothetical protein